MRRPRRTSRSRSVYAVWPRSADLEVYLRRLMATRRPPKEILQLAARRLGSDTYLFSGDRERLLDDIDRLLR